MYKERVISNIRLDMEKIAGADKEGDHEGGSKRWIPLLDTAEKAKIVGGIRVKK